MKNPITELVVGWLLIIDTPPGGSLTDIRLDKIEDEYRKVCFYLHSTCPFIIVPFKSLLKMSRISWRCASRDSFLPANHESFRISFQANAIIYNGLSEYPSFTSQATSPSFAASLSARHIPCLRPMNICSFSIHVQVVKLSSPFRFSSDVHSEHGKHFPFHYTVDIVTKRAPRL